MRYVYSFWTMISTSKKHHRASCSKTENLKKNSYRVKFQNGQYLYHRRRWSARTEMKKYLVNKRRQQWIKTPLLVAGDYWTTSVQSSYINWITMHIQVNKSYRFGRQLFSSSKGYFEDHRICQDLIVKI